MRVRILKPIQTANRRYRTGQIANVSPAKAESWFNKGWAMQDKSLNGATEVKRGRRRK
jgi:hypothetical protein